MPLKRSLIRHQSSINDHRPSAVVSTIHLDDPNEMESTSNSLNISRINTTLSERSIPLDEIELSRLIKQPNVSQISTSIKHKKRRRKKLIHLNSTISPHPHTH